MTTTVFLSGSRKISRLNDVIRSRVKNMIDKGVRIVIGDANGADKAFQAFLAESNYRKVIVFCVGNVCRNNVGMWPVKNIDADAKLQGREFYAQKDKAMASEAEYGFVLWDGKSAGSIDNVLQLIKGGKLVVIYFGPEKTFYTLKYASDVQTLLGRCDDQDYRNMNNKIHLDRRLKDLGSPVQGSLNL
jgi:hypothetical protein